MLLEKLRWFFHFSIHFSKPTNNCLPHGCKTKKNQINIFMFDFTIQFLVFHFTLCFTLRNLKSYYVVVSVNSSFVGTKKMLSSCLRLNSWDVHLTFRTYPVNILKHSCFNYWKPILYIPSESQKISIWNAYPVNDIQFTAFSGSVVSLTVKIWGRFSNIHCTWIWKP